MTTLALEERIPANWEAVGVGRVSSGAMLLTWARLPLGGVIVGAMALQAGIFGVVALTLFVVLDLLDGSVARFSGADTARRRAVDSGIDRLVTSAAMIAAGMHQFGLGLLGCLLAVVSVLAYPTAKRSLADLGVVLRAPQWHKTWSLTLALAGVLYLAGAHSMAMVAATVGVLIAAGCTADLVRVHRRLQA